jgi:hypothetical protein
MTAEPIGEDALIPPPAPELLRRYGTPEIALRRLRSRHHQRLLMRTSTVDDAAFTQRDTRVEALRLAAEHDGVVIDLSIPRVVEGPVEDVSLAHAAQWYVVDYDELEAGRLRTLGLTSFGLPEVVVSDVDRQHHAMFGAVLAGLAHRLIAEWPKHDPVGRATVTLRDIAYGLGDRDASQTPTDRAVEVEVTYDADAGVLAVTLLADPAIVLFAP